MTGRAISRRGACAKGLGRSGVGRGGGGWWASLGRGWTWTGGGRGGWAALREGQGWGSAWGVWQPLGSGRVGWVERGVGWGRVRGQGGEASLEGGRAGRWAWNGTMGLTAGPARGDTAACAGCRLEALGTSLPTHFLSEQWPLMFAGLHRAFAGEHRPLPGRFVCASVHMSCSAGVHISSGGTHAIGAWDRQVQAPYTVCKGASDTGTGTRGGAGSRPRPWRRTGPLAGALDRPVGGVRWRCPLAANGANGAYGGANGDPHPPPPFLMTVTQKHANGAPPGDAYGDTLMGG